MIALLLLASATAAAAPAPGSPPATDYDAVAAAPASHRVLAEDDAVRVLRVEVAPGATEPVHAHCWPSVLYFEQPQPITYTEYALTDGAPVAVRSVDAPAMPAGSAVSTGPEGLHAVKNRGTAPFVALRVEMKRPGDHPEGCPAP